MYRNRFFVAIEGIDGAGKLTQSDQLTRRMGLEGFPSSLVSFPDYESTTGKALRQYLAKAESWLNYAHPMAIPYAAASIFAINRIEYMATYAGSMCDHVVFNRYVLSNMVYQSGKMYTKIEQIQLANWIADYEFAKLLLPKPHLTVILDLPVEISRQMISSRQGDTLDAYEGNSDLLEHCRAQYLYMARCKSYDLNYKVISCVSSDGFGIRPIESIAEEIWEAVKVPLGEYSEPSQKMRRELA